MKCKKAKKRHKTDEPFFVEEKKNNVSSADFCNHEVLEQKNKKYEDVAFTIKRPF